MSDKNHFDDMGDLDGQQGIFGGADAVTGRSAIDDVTRGARTQAQQDGYHIHHQCEGCGRHRDTIVEYPELIAVKYRVSPHLAYQGIRVPMMSGPLMQWGYDSQRDAWFPGQSCACNYGAKLLVTVSEATSVIDKALQRGWLPIDLYNQLAQRCHQVQSMVQQQQQQVRR